MPQFLTMDRDDETRLSEVLSGTKAETLAEMQSLANKVAETKPGDWVPDGITERLEHLQAKLERLTQAETLSASGGA